MPQPFVITKDGRGAQVHVRRRDTGECIGCIEAGLYEVVRAVIAEEVAAPTEEGISVEAARRAMVAR